MTTGEINGMDDIRIQEETRPLLGTRSGAPQPWYSGKSVSVRFDWELGFGFLRPSRRDRMLPYLLYCWTLVCFCLERSASRYHQEGSNR